MSKAKLRGPTIPERMRMKGSLFSEPVVLNDLIPKADWSWFEEYYKKNRHRFTDNREVGSELRLLEWDLGRKPSEAERRETVEKVARRLAKKDYPDWYRRKREEAQEKWVDRLMKRGAPDQVEIVGLPNIAQALGYSVNTLKHDTNTKRRLEEKGIIRKGPDGRWRALKEVCDAFREGRKKK